LDVAPPEGKSLFKNKNCVGGFTTIAIFGFVIVYAVYSLNSYNSLSNTRIDLREIESTEVLPPVRAPFLFLSLWVCVCVVADACAGKAVDNHGLAFDVQHNLR
jgi:hypothetical protein